MEKQRKNLTKCPVCGRFITAERVKSHNQVIDSLRHEIDDVKRNYERSQAEVARLQKTIGQHDQTVSALHKTISDQAKHINGLNGEVEMYKHDAQRRGETIDKLLARSWWQRLRNIMPD